MKCDRCSSDRPSELMESVALDSEYLLCKPCISALSEYIEKHDWRTRYTEEQHERAIELLSSYDEIRCVISSYEDGQIVVHTPYVSSNVVTDVCNHFGFRIVSFQPQWSEDAVWPCMTEHGSIFEIVLEYNHRCQPPAPINIRFTENHIQELDGNDKQF